MVCVDNLYTGAKRNIDHLHDNPRFEFVRHDITFPLYIEIDQIYNLACPASPIHYQSDPVQTNKTIVHGAINMLGLAKRTKARIFQASRHFLRQGGLSVRLATTSQVGLAIIGRVQHVGVRHQKVW